MGKVYLVGAGPGDPELLTLKAHRIISRADVILYDALVNREILNFAKEDAVKIYVGKRIGRHSLPQEEINRLLHRFALTYDTVVRLKGGDPFVFGRGGEEYLYLRERGIEVEVVPGITSAVGAPSSINVPLTHRGTSSSFAVVSGHPGMEVDWKGLSQADTLVILMGVKRRREIAKELISSGRDPDLPVVFIEKATTEDQREVFSTLGEVAHNPPEVNPPAVMVVGRVVELSDLKSVKVSREDLLS